MSSGKQLSPLLNRSFGPSVISARNRDANRSQQIEANKPFGPPTK
jgi:hypothetical protein